MSVHPVLAPVLAPLLAALAPLLAALAALVPLAPPSSLPPVQGVVAEVMNRVARDLGQRRGVRLGRAIPVDVLDRAHLAAALAAAQEDGRSPEEARDRMALLARLGLVPDPDLPASAPARGSRRPPPLSPDGEPFVDVGGFYDPARGRLVVGDFVDLDEARFPLARDAAQAVLDRRFGLTRWLAGGPAGPARPVAPPTPASSPLPASDAFWARQALLEGDATVQALELLARDGNLPTRRQLAAITESVRAAMVRDGAGLPPIDLGRRLFVYLDGLAFVAAVRARAPWSEVDALWAAPPASTEQILHPDKYQRREPPDPVGARLPESLMGGWRASVSDTLGELGVRLFLAQELDEDRAYRGAAGWAGDRALLFKRAPITEGGAPDLLAAWVTTWDRDADAEDFAAQAARVLAARAGVPVARLPVNGDRVRLGDGAGRLYLGERRGRTVALLLAAPAEAEGALSELLAAATRGKDRRARRR